MFESLQLYYRRISSQTSIELGKSIKNLIPKVTKDRLGGRTSRSYSYTFPSLEECRKCYEKYCKQTEAIWDSV